MSKPKLIVKINRFLTDLHPQHCCELKSLLVQFVLGREVPTPLKGFAHPLKKYVHQFYHLLTIVFFNTLGDKRTHYIKVCQQTPIANKCCYSMLPVVRLVYVQYMCGHLRRFSWSEVETGKLMCFSTTNGLPFPFSSTATPGNWTGNCLLLWPPRMNDSVWNIFFIMTYFTSGVVDFCWCLNTHALQTLKRFNTIYKLIFH